MSLKLSNISNHVEKVSTWNPSQSSTLDAFKYIDLSSVDKDKKVISLQDVPLINPIEAPSRARQIAKANDVLVATVRPNLNGVAVVPDELDGATASTGYCVLRADNHTLDFRYLYHWVKMDSFVKDMMNKATGASYPAVSDKIIKESKIPLPPLDEQKRIAAILDKADSIRRKRQQAIQLADEFLRAVFLDMFGDPVTNPKGWRSVKLGNLCEVGSSKRVFVDEFTEFGIPFYRGTEVGRLAENEDIQPHIYISNDHYENLKKHSGVPEIGDLLLPSICHDGRIWKVDHKAPFYFKDGRVLWIKVNQSSINSDYLRSYLRNLFLANYSSIASGTTFAELKIVILKELSILNPPLDLQIKFAEITEKAIKKYRVSKAFLESSDELFCSLSQKAFAGEL